MPVNLNRRLRPDDLKNDRNAFAAIGKFDDYAPRNPACTLAELARLHEEMLQAQANELHSQNAADAARDAAVVAECQFHSALTTAKQQIVAQYGDDSDNVSAVGLKKRSERRRPAVRRNEPTE